MFTSKETIWIAFREIALHIYIRFPWLFRFGFFVVFLIHHCNLFIFRYRVFLFIFCTIRFGKKNSLSFVVSLFAFSYFIHSLFCIEVCWLKSGSVFSLSLVSLTLNENANEKLTFNCIKHKILHLLKWLFSKAIFMWIGLVSLSGKTITTFSLLLSLAKAVNVCMCSSTLTAATSNSPSKTDPCKMVN